MSRPSLSKLTLERNHMLEPKCRARILEMDEQEYQAWLHRVLGLCARACIEIDIENAGTPKRMRG